MHSASWNYDAQTKPHFLCLLLQISFVAHAFGVIFKEGMNGYVVLDTYWPVVNINPTKRVEVVSMSACLDKKQTICVLWVPYVLDAVSFCRAWIHIFSRKTDLRP